MSNCKTIVTFSSGRTVTLDSDWVDEIHKKASIDQFQFFRSGDGDQWSTVINMGLV